MSVALDQFVATFAALDVGRRGSISLRDRQLRIVARHPAIADAETVGKTLPVPPLQALIDEGGASAAYVTDRTLDGVERRFSVRRISAQPLYVVVGRSTEDDLAGWRDEAAKAGEVLALFFIGTLASSWLIYRVWQRQMVAADEAARAEEEVRKLNAELERRVVERTAALEAANTELEEFSYSVSHDLRSPVRAIVGFGRILEEEYGDRLDDEGRRLLAIVQDNGQRMGLLIDGILTFLHLGRIALRILPVNLTALAREVYAELAPADRQVEFEVGNLPDAHGDPKLLRQVLANLLANAIRFSARKERPQIRVGGYRGAGGEYLFRSRQWHRFRYALRRQVVQGVRACACDRIGRNGHRTGHRQAHRRSPWRPRMGRRQGRRRRDVLLCLADKTGESDGR